MAAFSGRLGKDWLGVWARVRQHGQKTEGRMCTERLQPCVSTAEQLAERVKEYLEDN